MPAIRYIARDRIDTAAWDRCLDGATNGSIYGYSRYLDAMADHWDGLVLNEYEAVMPLPWRRKWGIAYLYPPFATAQLGLFGKNPDASLLQDFLDAVPRRFRYWDLPLNRGNNFALRKYALLQRQNFILSLRQPYEKLYKGYRENCRRNIRKWGAYGCAAANGVSSEEVVALAKAGAGAGSNEDYNRFLKLYGQLQQEGWAQTWGLRSAGGALLASGIFFFSHRRAYYILVGNHPNGRTLGASHALIDAFIREHAGHDLTLDFEGSDLRNLAFFYSGFGAQQELYTSIKFNRLPFYLKWLKK